MRRVFHLIIMMLFLASEAAANGVGNTNCPVVRIEAERLPDMTVPRSGHSALMLNGELTVVGGHTSGFVLTQTAEYLKDGEWHNLNTVYMHDGGLSIVLKSGKVMLAGGFKDNLGIGQSYEVEIYDPLLHTFKGFGCLDQKRVSGAAVELDGGRVMIVGNCLPASLTKSATFTVNGDDEHEWFRIGLAKIDETGVDGIYTDTWTVSVEENTWPFDRQATLTITLIDANGLTAKHTIGITQKAGDTQEGSAFPSTFQRVKVQIQGKYDEYRGDRKTGTYRIDEEYGAWMNPDDPGCTDVIRATLSGSTLHVTAKQGDAVTIEFDITNITNPQQYDFYTMGRENIKGSFATNIKVHAKDGTSEFQIDSSDNLIGNAYSDRIGWYDKPSGMRMWTWYKHDGVSHNEASGSYKSEDYTYTKKNYKIDEIQIALFGYDPEEASARLRGAQKRQTNTTTETITRFVER